MMAAEETSLPSIDESARKRFEAAWKQECPERIEQYLPPAEDPRYLATLEELIHIELEFAWKAAQMPRQGVRTVLAPPVLERYLERFPCLNQKSILQRLLE